VPGHELKPQVLVVGGINGLGQNLGPIPLRLRGLAISVEFASNLV
jgi:hypothetical protein